MPCFGVKANHISPIVAYLDFSVASRRGAVCGGRERAAEKGEGES
jgi:hypothetical protein